MSIGSLALHRRPGRPESSAGASTRISLPLAVHLARLLLCIAYRVPFDCGPIWNTEASDVSGWLRWDFVNGGRGNGTDLWIGVKPTILIEMLVLVQDLPTSRAMVAGSEHA